MFIRRFLIVSCLASGIVGIVWLFKGKVVNLDYEYWNSSIIENIDNNSYNKDKYEANDSSRLNLYNEESNNEVLLILDIPRISLRKSVYTMDSSKNNVDLNVELLDGSVEELNLYFLASHSGNGKANYFNDLFILEKGDVIWLYKDSGNLGYVIDEIFYIEKKGYFEVSYGSDGNRIFLITCSLEYRDKQLVVTGELVYSDKC